MVASVLIMIYRKLKKEVDPLWTYLPLILLLSYAVVFSGLLNTSPKVFILMPLLPLVIFLITTWIYKLFRQLPGKYGPVAFALLFAMLFLMNSKTIPGEVPAKSVYRFYYDTLKDKVNPGNKLLIAPVLIWDGDVYKSDLYFGRENAIYMADLPIDKEYNLSSLTELLKFKKILYVFLNRKLLYFMLNAGNMLPKRYQNWFCNEKVQYSAEKDLVTIQA